MEIIAKTSFWVGFYLKKKIDPLIIWFCSEHSTDLFSFGCLKITILILLGMPVVSVRNLFMRRKTNTALFDV